MYYLHVHLSKQVKLGYESFIYLSIFSSDEKVVYPSASNYSVTEKKFQIYSLVNYQLVIDISISY